MARQYEKIQIKMTIEIIQLLHLQMFMVLPIKMF